jgi:hypothetical protein
MVYDSFSWCCAQHIAKTSHNKPLLRMNLSEFYRQIFNAACATGHQGLGGVAFGVTNTPALPSRARIDERIMIMLGQSAKLLKLLP